MHGASFDASPDHMTPEAHKSESRHRSWRLANPHDTGPYDRILESIDKWLMRIFLALLFTDFLLHSARLPGGKQLFVICIVWLIVPLFFSTLVEIGKHFRFIGADACKSKPLRDVEGIYTSHVVTRPPIFRAASDSEKAQSGMASTGGAAPAAGNADKGSSLFPRKQSLTIKGRGVVTYWVENHS
jgi:hypothetical protein